MKRAFTLIELLVVIAIIAILAAILFPVFAQAREAAKKTADLNNMKQIGISMQMYLTDNDDTYPSAYYYRNDASNAGTAPNCGYVNWSGMLQPYTKNLDIFKSPGDKNGGLAPTNFVGNNRGYGVPSGQITSGACSIADDQAPRLSYIPNSMVMPRKRRSADPMNVIQSTSLDEGARTIVLAPMTDSATCINDASSASGTAFKTHRPANAILLPTGAKFQGEDVAEVGLAFYQAVTAQRVRNELKLCEAGTGASTYSHMVYTKPNRFGGNIANYMYGDTHAKAAPLEATLNPTKWQWGLRAYTAGGGEIRTAAGVAVQ